MKKKIITIVGARPQIIKSSAISRAIAKKFNEQLEEVIVHTGQHYDENMSAVFFDEMGIPQPNYNLNVGSGTHGAQTAKMIEGLESIFLSEKPNGVLVYGDTNSTIAGALAAIKIHIPVIHVEAGLRSFNKSMPEEVNRIACDHMSTLLFTPTSTGLDNLKREGFSDNREGKASADQPKVYHCGDIMYDNSLY
ncbi:MAG: UDP-N-acetyl glucosamine 2-epimerase, partial [Flavobacteriia bacterium]